MSNSSSENRMEKKQETRFERIRRELKQKNAKFVLEIHHTHYPSGSHSLGVGYSSWKSVNIYYLGKLSEGEDVLIEDEKGIICFNTESYVILGSPLSFSPLSITLDSGKPSLYKGKIPYSAINDYEYFEKKYQGKYKEAVEKMMPLLVK